MKKTITLALIMVLCASFMACGSSNAAQTEVLDEVPTAQPVSENCFDDDTIKAFLESTFDVDGFDTLVDISNGEINVFLTSKVISEAYLEAYTGDESAVKKWDGIVNALLGLHNVAYEFVSEYSDYSISTTINDDKDYFPYISITDGEVIIDFLHIGE